MTQRLLVVEVIMNHILVSLELEKVEVFSDDHLRCWGKPQISVRIELDQPNPNGSHLFTMTVPVPIKEISGVGESEEYAEKIVEEIKTLTKGEKVVFKYVSRCTTPW